MKDESFDGIGKEIGGNSGGECGGNGYFHCKCALSILSCLLVSSLLLNNN